MRGYPQFSCWISIALAKICFFRCFFPHSHKLHKNTLILVGTLLKISLKGLYARVYFVYILRRRCAESSELPCQAAAKVPMPGKCYADHLYTVNPTPKIFGVTCIKCSACKAPISCVIVIDAVDLMSPGLKQLLVSDFDYRGGMSSAAFACLTTFFGLNS